LDSFGIQIEAFKFYISMSCDMEESVSCDIKGDGVTWKYGLWNGFKNNMNGLI